MPAMSRWIVLLLLLCACAPVATPTPTVPPTLADTRTLTPTATRVLPTATQMPSATPSPTNTPTPTLTPTPLWPTPQMTMQGRKVNVPILMYHYVEPWPNNASLVRRGLTVRPENFAAQMQYLHDNGFETVGLTEVLLALTRDTPLPPKPIVITFDDGYAGLMANALPVLQQYHYTATVFVITEFMDFNRPEYLSWDDAKKLRAAGWEIEPHTKSHEELNGKSRDLQIYQMLGAMQTIEANLGYMPRFFCYPAGKYDALTIELAKELNLWGGVITVQGRDHTFADRYTWTRQRVDGQGDMKAFINLVRSP